MWYRITSSPALQLGNLSFYGNYILLHYKLTSVQHFIVIIQHGGNLIYHSSRERTLTLVATLHAIAIDEIEQFVEFVVPFY